MLITCPDCGTNFSIPDTALGTEGRKLKCAKCGHKWFQSPLMVDEPSDDVFADEPPPPPPPPPRPVPPRPAPPPPPVFDPLDGLDIAAPPVPQFGGRLDPDRPQGDPAASILDDQPQPIPEVFATHDSSGRRPSTWALWLLLVVLLLGALGGAAFYFQDRLVDLVPELGDVMIQAGLRVEKPGAGLELRKAGTPERLVLNEVEVLVVRGVIANISDRTRAVPPMKLVLMDKANQPVQEKLSRAPVAELSPQGTASFKIVLERPDPNAVKVEVVFIGAGDAPALAAPQTRAPAPRPAADLPPEAPPAPAAATPDVPPAPAAAAPSVMAPAAPPAPAAPVPAPAAPAAKPTPQAPLPPQR